MDHGAFLLEYKLYRLNRIQSDYRNAVLFENLFSRNEMLVLQFPVPYFP